MEPVAREGQVQSGAHAKHCGDPHSEAQPVYRRFTRSFEYFSSEFSSHPFDAWAYARGIAIDFIGPGRPTQNGFIESFNGKLRDECMRTGWFETLANAQDAHDAWAADYNESRRHSSLANLSPNACAARVLGVCASDLVAS